MQAATKMDYTDNKGFLWTISVDGHGFVSAYMVVKGKKTGMGFNAHLHSIAGDMKNHIVNTLAKGN